MKVLRRTLFGNPILRTKSRHLTLPEITHSKTQLLIENMRTTLEKRPYGVGLAAPQVGAGIALTVIGIKPTPNRPDVELIHLVLINPQIIKTHGKRTAMWEGCISLGSGSDSPYAKALRYRKITVRYLDENAQQHEETYEGLLAHVVQHEVDHLNGILFVDRVRDTKSYITQSEYRKRYVQKHK